MAYATLAEVRALDGLDDVVTFPDASLTEGISYATSIIDTECGPMEPKSVTVRLAPSAGALYTGLTGIRSVVSCTADGTVLDVGAWEADPDGWVYPDVSLQSYYTLVLVVSASEYDTAPEPIRWAARTIARQYLLDLKARTPDRATAVQSEMGTIQIAQAGASGRPTSMPDVNAVLVRFGTKARFTA